MNVVNNVRVKDDGEDNRYDQELNFWKKGRKFMDI